MIKDFVTAFLMSIPFLVVIHKMIDKSRMNILTSVLVGVISAWIALCVKETLGY